MLVVGYLNYLKGNFPMERSIVGRLHDLIFEGVQNDQVEFAESDESSSNTHRPPRIGKDHNQVFRDLAAYSALFTL